MAQPVERDPVCGMEVRPEEATATAEFQGTTYYFCSEECRARFLQNPLRYVGGR